MTKNLRLPRPAIVTDKPQLRFYQTYWLTRDLRAGKLADKVQVWLALPDRIQFSDGDVMWMAPCETTHAEALYGEWTLTQAYHEARAGVPEDSRQCTRVGPESDIRAPKPTIENGASS